MAILAAGIQIGETDCTAILVSAKDEPQATTRNASASQWVNGRWEVMLDCRWHGWGHLHRRA